MFLRAGQVLTYLCCVSLGRHVVVAHEPEVHQSIALEAFEQLTEVNATTEMRNELRRYIGEVGDDRFDFAFGNDCIDGETVCAGASDADCWSSETGRYLLEPPITTNLDEVTYFGHFWDPDEGLDGGLHFCWRDQPLDYPSAVRKAAVAWRRAVTSYELVQTDADRATAYYWLGHVAHHLGDISCACTC